MELPQSKLGQSPLPRAIGFRKGLPPARTPTSPRVDRQHDQCALQLTVIKGNSLLTATIMLGHLEKSSNLHCGMACCHEGTSIGSVMAWTSSHQWGIPGGLAPREAPRARSTPDVRAACASWPDRSAHPAAAAATPLTAILQRCRGFSFTADCPEGLGLGGCCHGCVVTLTTDAASRDVCAESTSPTPHVSWRRQLGSPARPSACIPWKS